MKKFFGIVLVSWVVFFVSWLFVYKTGTNTLAIQSEDTIPAMFLPVTIIKEGTFYADSYYQMIIKRYPHPDDKQYTKGLTPFYFRKIAVDAPTKFCVGEGCALRSHYISAFPVMAGLLSLPVYFLPILMGMPATWDNLILLSHLSASLIVALSGGFFYLLAKMLLIRKFFQHDTLGQDNLDAKGSVNTYALWLTVVYLFGTVNFAMVSRSLWQHGPVQLFTILSLLFLFSNFGYKVIANQTKQFRWVSIFISGVFLGLAVLSRPTAGILIPFFVLLAVYLTNRDLVNSRLTIKSLGPTIKSKVAVLAGLLPTLAFFIWYNATYFVDISNQGYANQISRNWLTPFPWGFLGLWFSPSKGILIYSSVFIFSLIGAYLALKKGGWRKNFIELVFLSIILTHTFTLGAWKHWYGGYSFGYRMASDVTPFLVLLLIPYLKSSIFSKTKKLFYLAIILSILFELMGMVFFDGIWHGTYDKGFWHQSWLWSITNSEVSFNIRRLLVKLSL